MTQQPFHPEHGPTPEQLAAFTEGELDSEASARVEAWLAEHSDDHDLLPLFHASVPAELPEATWNAALARIHEGVSTPARPPLRPRWGLRLLVGLTAAATAAALAGIWLVPPWLSRQPDQPVIVTLPPGDDDDEPFPVALAQEVAIISVHPRDADAIVLGGPLLGSMDWVEPEDIQVIEVAPHPDDGQVPWLMEDGPVPMILASSGDR
jgi:hypothetical protein